MSFKIQELPDTIKLVTLLELQGKKNASKTQFKDRLNHICVRNMCIDVSELNKALSEIVAKRLITLNDGTVSLTSSGELLSDEWENLFVSEEPMLEVISELTDSCITSLVLG